MVVGSCEVYCGSYPSLLLFIVPLSLLVDLVKTIIFWTFFVMYKQKLKRRESHLEPVAMSWHLEVLLWKIKIPRTYVTLFDRLQRSRWSFHFFDSVRLSRGLDRLESPPLVSLWADLLSESFSYVKSEGRCPIPQNKKDLIIFSLKISYKGMNGTSRVLEKEERKILRLKWTSSFTVIFRVCRRMDDKKGSLRTSLMIYTKVRDVLLSFESLKRKKSLNGPSLPLNLP